MNDKDKEQEGHLKCRLCDYRSDNLASHIRYNHDLSLDEYKEKFPNDKLGYCNHWNEEKIKKMKKKHKKTMQKKYGVDNSMDVEKFRKKVSESNKGKISIWNYEYWMEKENYTKIEAKEKVSSIQSKLSSRSNKFKGHSHSKETRNRISEKMSLHIENYNNENGELWSSHFQQYNGTVSSKKEIEVFDFVKKLDYDKIESNKQILNQYHADIIVNDQYVIEFFGDFWHVHNSIFENESKKHPVIDKTISEIRKNDKKRLANLIKNDYNVLVIWGHEWNNNIKQCKKKIKEFLNGNNK